MSKEGLKLAALYSYGCPRSKKLGINQILLDFIRYAKNQSLVEKELQKLLSYAYYKIIASRNNIDDTFDERVIRAYWTGNELTEVVESENSSIFLFHNFTALQSIHRTPEADPDNCIVSVSRIKEAEKESTSVYHRTLILKESLFSLSKRSEIKEIERNFIKKRLMREDWINYHWGIAREPLREEEAISLINKTKRAIKLFNEQQSS